MAVKRTYFDEYLALFPPEVRAKRALKLDFKRHLESDNRLKIPAHIWLAFLTPPEESLQAYLPKKYAAIKKLKAAMLEIVDEPRKFIEMRDPFHAASACVTLAILECLYDLEESKVLLPRERYEEWLDVANHFGLWKLRYALEDVIFKTFDPENYELFQSVIQQQLFVDNHLILSVRGIISDALHRAGISDFLIENRVKNIYGVYRKVALKEKSVNDIYDIHGFRILAGSEADCRRILEVLHQLWRPYPDKFKDYIASPKANGYQSIHTVLQCLQRKTIEFQIRTREMDAIAASGPANHAAYKHAVLVAD